MEEQRRALTVDLANELFAEQDCSELIAKALQNWVRARSDALDYFYRHAENEEAFAEQHMSEMQVFSFRLRTMEYWELEDLLENERNSALEKGLKVFIQKDDQQKEVSEEEFHTFLFEFCCIIIKLFDDADLTKKLVLMYHLRSMADLAKLRQSHFLVAGIDDLQKIRQLMCIAAIKSTKKLDKALNSVFYARINAKLMIMAYKFQKDFPLKVLPKDVFKIIISDVICHQGEVVV